MTSNRPFLSNFLAAFRAHSSAIPKASPSITTSTNAVSAVASAQTVWSSGSTQSQQLSTVSAPRSIHTKSQAQQQHPNQSTQAAVSQSQLHSALSPLQHNVSPLTHAPRSPPSPGLATSQAGTPVYGPPNRPTQSYPTPQEAARRTRRGSDSSSDGGAGFRDVLGGEKWYIGGRTAGGEERFYKLSMVRRDRSADRLSADRLSL